MYKCDGIKKNGDDIGWFWRAYICKVFGFSLERSSESSKSK